VTSAPANSKAGDKAGRIYVFSTKSSKLLWKADGQAADELGTGVEAAGDANGDGIPDVIASAPDGGYAKIYSGREGRVLLTLRAENSGDQFGRHTTGIGDVNHDGFADVIVGAPNNNAAGEKAGRAYVYSGKDGSLLLTLSGEHAGDAFGSAVGGYADKEHLLLLVGALNAGRNHAGRTYVYDTLSTKPKFTIEADETGNALGAMFLSVPGDVDGDGSRMFMPPIGPTMQRVRRQVASMCIRERTGVTC
jgi:FG-GAP repeat